MLFGLRSALRQLGLRDRCKHRVREYLWRGLPPSPIRSHLTGALRPGRNLFVVDAKGLAICLDGLRRSGPYFTGPGSLEPTGARFVLAHEVSIRRPPSEGRCRMIAAEQACAPHPTLHRMLSERRATLVAALSIAFVRHSCNLAEQLTLYRRAMFSMRTWHSLGHELVSARNGTYSCGRPDVPNETVRVNDEAR